LFFSIHRSALITHVPVARQNSLYYDLFMQRNGRHHPLKGYGIAVAGVGAAAIVTHFLRGLGDVGIAPQFFAAILLSAWYGGLGPGLLAIALSAIATGYFLLPPNSAHAGEAIGAYILRLVVFTIVALLTNALHAATRRAAAEADRARQAAESASTAKSRFLAMVSHELRTPLSPVLMIAEILEQDPSLPQRVRRDMANIRRNVELERRLIDDLVDLTRISSGKMGLQRQPVDVHEPLSQAIRVCENEAAEKGLKINTRFEASGSMLDGDADRLQQVFWNLMRNAIKFTPAGGTIDIGSSNIGGNVVVTIADTGIGVDPERLSTIFEAFEQGGADIQSRFGGLGLGLAICHALTEAHGGSIRAQSEGPGKGATFVVTFPTLPQSTLSTDAQLAAGRRKRTPEIV
jgi:signal transduction histidine kinase